MYGDGGDVGTHCDGLADRFGNGKCIDPVGMIDGDDVFGKISLLQGADSLFIAAKGCGLGMRVRWHESTGLGYPKMATHLRRREQGRRDEKLRLLHGSLAVNCPHLTPFGWVKV